MSDQSVSCFSLFSNPEGKLSDPVGLFVSRLSRNLYNSCSCIIPRSWGLNPFGRVGLPGTSLCIFNREHRCISAQHSEQVFGVLSDVVRQCLLSGNEYPFSFDVLEIFLRVCLSLAHYSFLFVALTFADVGLTCAEAGGGNGRMNRERRVVLPSTAIL